MTHRTWALRQKEGSCAELFFFVTSGTFRQHKEKNNHSVIRRWASNHCLNENKRICRFWKDSTAMGRQWKGTEKAAHWAFLVFGCRLVSPCFQNAKLDVVPDETRGEDGKLEGDWNEYWVVSKWRANRTKTNGVLYILLACRYQLLDLHHHPQKSSDQSQSKQILT